jgi:predicted ester cyclase
MTTQTNRDVVRAIYEDCLNAGRVELLDRLVAPEFLGVHNDVGHAGFARTLTGLRNAFPDIHYDLEDLIEDGDRVAVRFKWSGTHRASFRCFPPSHVRVCDTGIAIYHLRAGKIIRTWLETNRLGFLVQIGALPLALTAHLNGEGALGGTPTD